MDAQMKKGVLEMCILYWISIEEMYGYDVMKRMSCFFPEVNDSTFYAILRRMAKEGFAEIQYGKESNGPRRKYYHITLLGEKYLSDSKEDWKNLIRIIKEISIE